MIAGARAVIEIATFKVLESVELVAVTKVLVVPLTVPVGVPEMTPVVVSIFRPAGRGDALKLVGVLVAVME